MNTAPAAGTPRWLRRVPRHLLSAATACLLGGLVVVQPVSATLPGRNGLLAFSADPGTGSQIYTVDERGRHLRKLTHVTGNAIAPHWSPDSRRIVFELDSISDPGCSIMVMNADGSHVAALTAHNPNHCNENPTFTPDGSRILFDRAIGVASCTPDGNCTITDQAIWSMNVRGGDQRRITNGVGGAYAPEISPDGTLISFDSQYEGVGNALFVARIDGSHRHRLTTYAMDVQYKHEWAPDGRHIVFTAHPPTDPESLNVATIGADGKDLTFLTAFTAPDTGFAGSYSPDGRWIAYRAEVDGQFSLLAMSPDGGTQEQILAPSSLRPRYITWGSPSR